MANKMICTSCGGEFEDNLPKCPYCGTMNLSGAEAEYMEKLDDVREDLDDLKDVPIEETKKEIRKQGRFLKKIFTVLGIIVAVILVICGILKWQDYKEEQNSVQGYYWRQKNFPILNQLYEDGKYDEMVAFCEKALEEEKPVRMWEHMDFCDIYRKVLFAEHILHREEQGVVLEQEDYENLFFVELSAVTFPNGEGADEQERAIIASHEELTRDFEERWGLTEEERNGLIEEVKENYNMIRAGMCTEFVEKWYTER